MINLLVSNCWLGTWINHDKPIGFDTIDIHRCFYAQKRAS